jgi:ATP-dependent RNA helicase HelY
VTVRDDLLARYGFPLDRFQLDAIVALDAGSSVLVAAPTGSGKTVVAEYAVGVALAHGRRAFYTAPIKALSNQKYRDLLAVHGPDRVGLLTGDNSINGDADVVVMTTEVLRNMVYARHGGLDRLDVVVLDEVHYLQDAYRGPVWEEVILHLPAHVRLVCLSATVSNAAELAAWITEVRGPTVPVVEHRRPVRLDHLYLVGDRSVPGVHALPVLVDGRANPEGGRFDPPTHRVPGRPGRPRARLPVYTPRRLEVVDLLEERDLLPAIYFLFSRNGCDEAAAQCLDAGVRLTTAAERTRIRAIVDEHLAGIDSRDLAVLGQSRFLAALEAGVAAHHAGLIPPFKEAVEACFAEALVKVVFATETLAVGINMPARTVVIEKLTKFTGNHHEFLTPGAYTQLTGRAGRRGIDDMGHAAVLWNPFVTFDQVAALALSREYQLRSAFRPTYNMAANLVRTRRAEEARSLLGRSFAQFQADREVVRLEQRLQRRSQLLAEVRAEAISPFGDLEDYRSRRRLQRDAGAEVRAGRTDPEAIEHALLKLRPGDVIDVVRGRRPGRAAVVSVAFRRGVRVRAVTASRTVLTLGAADFDAPPRAVGRVELPDPFDPRAAGDQRDVARRLARSRFPRSAGVDDELEDHPVLADPDLADRLRAAAAAERLAREVDELTARVHARGSSVVRRFEQVLALLGAWRYVEGWTLTPAGERLARLFHECDLLVAECLEQGLLDGLDAASLAALVSAFTYEHRSPEPPPAAWFPSGTVRRRYAEIESVARSLNAQEELAGLDPTRAPDPTFVAVAYAWAAGESFAAVVDAEELSGGDFVRNMKQLVDLLRQIAQIAPEPATRAAAAAGVELLFRGVIVASSRVDGATVDGGTVDGGRSEGAAW